MHPADRAASFGHPRPFLLGWQAWTRRVRQLPCRRAEDTRQTILDSAVALYLIRGAENTTVSAIIRGARVGRTTYRYFKDADDVLNQAVIRDYETQRYERPGLDEQLIEDVIWFIRQFRRRPALKLLFADNSRQLYERVDEALAGASRAALACTRPTYERARRQGRLREGSRCTSTSSGACSS